MNGGSEVIRVVSLLARPRRGVVECSLAFARGVIEIGSLRVSSFFFKSFRERGKEEEERKMSLKVEQIDLRFLYTFKNFSSFSFNFNFSPFFNSDRRKNSSVP